MIEFERLETLAEVLDNVPSEKFNINFWCRAATESCGTAACAVGWAMNTPAFQKLGLKPIAISTSSAIQSLQFFGPFYHGLSDWDAVEAFFGLKEYQAFHLFLNTAYLTYHKVEPMEVAARIREFIATNRPPEPVLEKNLTASPVDSETQSSVAPLCVG